MLAHVVQSLRVTAGEVEMPDEKVPWVFKHAPLKHALIYVIPFAKGLPTSRVLLQREPAAADGEAWAAEQAAFHEALDRVGRKPLDEPWPTHAAFGRLTPRQWGVLQYRHIDHHFRQFGI
jgi:hypothetical protein